MTVRWCMLLIWGLGSGLSLFAQSDPAGPTRFEFSVMATERMRDVGFAQLKPEARSKPRPVAADFEIIPLRVSSQGRSDLYAYEGPMPLRIVATAPTAEGDGVRAVRMLGAWSHPVVPPRALLLLRPDPVQEGGLVVTLLDDTEAGFPARHVKVVNLSNRRVAGRIGDQSFVSTPAQPLLASQRVGESVSIGAAYDRGGTPAAIFDQSIRVGENERVLLVFLPPFREGADVRMRVVRDQLFRGEEPVAE